MKNTLQLKARQEDRISSSAIDIFQKNGTCLGHVTVAGLFVPTSNEMTTDELKQILVICFNFNLFFSNLISERRDVLKRELFIKSVTFGPGDSIATWKNFKTSSINTNDEVNWKAEVVGNLVEISFCTRDSYYATVLLSPLGSLSFEEFVFNFWINN